MATGIVLTVVEKLYAVLHSKELRDICSMFGYESQLDDLGVTVSTIKCVLLDAESKHQELTHGGRDYIERLKEAVYDVDDLLDEFNTMVQKEKNMNGSKVSKKVRRFFSRSNQFLVAFNMSHEIKNLRSKLDKIAKDRQQFGFSDVYVPVKRRQETMSFATEDSIIGREAEKEAIVGMLLGDLESPNDVCHKVYFVSIVGIGGLGKTALAQLVYNDSRIENAFELRLWVCISEDFDMQKIFCQMLGKELSKIEELQREVRKLIEGKKYLLVLDDAWSESRDEWDKLKSFLDLGRKGSKIVVTSRSKRVAKVVGDDMIHELEGLSEENSWNLFKRLAFKQGEEPINNDDRLFKTGKEIVSKCANVPLSIRVVGSMLYDQDESKWLSLRNANLMILGQGEYGIMSILKFSYYHLTPALKCCFSYCALFPKDFRIEKELLIRLWLAQGCLDQTHDCQSEEEIGEEYFSILLHRCFLQDVQEDEYGEIESCKMHDLIHDLAQEVAGKETIMLDTHESQFNHKIRHLSFTTVGHWSRCITHLREMKTVRTILQVRQDTLIPNDFESNVTSVCSHLRRLRVLDLCGFQFDKLPDTLGNLSHLRYLDLSHNKKLAVLPNSITKLHNLQVLNLDKTHVRELPVKMSKLVNLRHLILEYYTNLTHMPAGLGSLTNLRTLTMFVVGDETSKQGNICKLSDLKSLVNLRGALNIIFNNNSSCDVANYKEVELIRTHRLKNLSICFEDQDAIHETLLASLQPHSFLKGIEIVNYKGFKLPPWAESFTTSIPHLVKIDLFSFLGLEILPSLSQLRHLKYLMVEAMPNVKFMESGDQLLFFPSLEKLELRQLPKFKGWRREDTSRVKGVIPSFPRLHELALTTFPPCLNLKSLRLYGVNEALTLSGSTTMLYLKSLRTDNVEGLDGLFRESLGGIHHLYIENFKGECLSGVSEKYVRHASSIEKLDIFGFPYLRSVAGGGLEHLTNLRSLGIMNCDSLDLENNEESVMPWESLHLLSSLTLSGLPKLLNLPKGFQYLTSLQSFEINYSENLEALPEWLSCLTSLRELWIHGCPKLKSLPEAIAHIPSLIELLIYEYDCRNLSNRCREPDGEDWPKVRHIPCLRLMANDEDD